METGIITKAIKKGVLASPNGAPRYRNGATEHQIGGPGDEKDAKWRQNEAWLH